LVYHTFINEKHVTSGMRFYQAMGGLGWYSSNCTENRLIIHRSDFGMAVINKAGNWDAQKDIYLPGVRNGKWRELVYDFDIIIDNGKIVKWGDKQGLDIGPREVLFFCKVRHVNI